MKNSDLDSTMDVLDTMEARDNRNPNPDPNPNSMPRQNKVAIGTVEDFFDKISVVAIKLNGNLKVGDVIEIGDEEEAVRQKIISMQINRENVEEAGDGDSVGIKLKYKVSPGLSVYKISSV